MAVRVHVLLYKTFYVPGERVVCTVQVYNSASPSSTGNGGNGAAILKDLQFISFGTERTDTHWIKRLYHSEVVPEHIEQRRQVRTLYKTQSPPLLHDTIIPAGAAHQFRVRFRLPAVLPPTFKGQSCRFHYQLEVKALYTQQTAGSPGPSNYETTAATALTVWPRSPVSQQQRQLTPFASASIPEQSSQHQHSRPPDSPYAGMTNAMFARGASITEVTTPHASTGMPAPATAPLHTTPSINANTAAANGSADFQLRPPMLEYQLGQAVRIKCKEVPVDYALLHGHLSEDSTLQQGMPNLTSTDSPGPVTAQPTPSSSMASFTEHAQHTSSNGLGGSSYHQASGNFLPSTTNYLGTPTSVNRSAREQYAADMQLQARSHMHNARVQAMQDSDSSDSETEATGAGAAGWRASRGGASSTSLRAKLSLSGLSASHKQQHQPWGHAYSLKLREHTVMRVTLQAPLEMGLQPGSSFAGLVELRPGGLLGPAPSLVVHQLVVLLETEEAVAPECASRASSKQPASGVRKLICEHQELTSNMANTQFLFSIPSSATPSFETPMVAFRWMLRFELMVGPPLPLQAFGDAPLARNQRFEQLLWSLPLYVQT